MNLVQQANFLEDVPKDQLVSMSQDPNAQFPAFLVLSEIQRRTTNEKNYQAMVNQPTTTVAEEVVSDFAQPTGLQGGAPQATPLPTNISAGLSGAPTAPMQMAASGGITGYANEGQTKLNYSNLRTKLTEDEIKIVNQAVMRDRTQRMQSDLGDKTGKFLGGGANVSEQIFSVLSGGGGNIPIFRGSPEEKKFIEVANIILENKNKKMNELISELPKTFQTITMAPYCKDEEKYEVVEHLVKKMEKIKADKIKIDNLNIENILTVNGIRFALSDGSWGLIRASSNKPSLVVVTESPTSEERMKNIFKFIDNLLQKTGKVGEYDQKIKL